MNTDGAARRAASTRTEDADLVVLSHLRWDWVWQRPQHLISRVGRGRRTWFVEQPQVADVQRPRLRRVEAGPVTRVWLEVPLGTALQPWRTHDVATFGPLLRQLLGRAAEGSDVWVYDPAALTLVDELRPRLLVYDVMDDLAAFADAPPEMTLRMRRALTVADVVFAGGPSLYDSAVSVRGRDGTYLFPSGVELAHYARSRRLRRGHERPTAGYVGVIDERLDLELVRSLAERLPDWDIVLVGPVTKIDPDVLPEAPNLTYLGLRAYAELPEVMANLDVALMPFALNEATRSISPTKTLEYLAAGLPVVSTRVADVVRCWSGVVHLADDGEEFAAACRHVLGHSRHERDERVAPVAAEHEWDVIADRMREVLDDALARSAGQRYAGERQEIA